MRLPTTDLPAAVDGVDLGGYVLALGPGVGAVTAWLRTSVPRLMVLEPNPSRAAALRRRLAGAGVVVAEADGTAMPFPDASFSAVLSLGALRRIPSPALQDRLLFLVHRVLEPDGWFVGIERAPTPRWTLLARFGVGARIGPATLDRRLRAAGFVEVQVTDLNRCVTFRARRPA